MSAKCHNRTNGTAAKMHCGCLLSLAYDGFDIHTRFAVDCSLVDVVETVKLYQPIEWEPSLAVQLDQLRDKKLRHATRMHLPKDIKPPMSKLAAVPIGAAPTMPQLPRVPSASPAATTQPCQ
jgi:hypothetical protein